MGIDQPKNNLACINTLPQGRITRGLFHGLCLGALSQGERSALVYRMKKRLRRYTSEMDIVHQRIILRYVEPFLELYENSEKQCEHGQCKTIQTEDGEIHPFELHRIVYGVAWILEYGTLEEKERFHESLMVLFREELNKEQLTLKQTITSIVHILPR